MSKMANEKRLKDANALKAIFDERYDDAFMQSHTRPNIAWWEGYSAGVNWGRNTIEDVPTVDAVEVVHGRWEPHFETFDADQAVGILGGNYQTGWQCSVCGRYEPSKEPYCNCGAKMDGDGNG